MNIEEITPFVKTQVRNQTRDSILHNFVDLKKLSIFDGDILFFFVKSQDWNHIREYTLKPGTV